MVGSYTCGVVLIYQYFLVIGICMYCFVSAWHCVFLYLFPSLLGPSRLLKLFEYYAVEQVYIQHAHLNCSVSENYRIWVDEEEPGCLESQWEQVPFRNEIVNTCMCPYLVSIRLSWVRIFVIDVTLCVTSCKVLA